MLPLTTSERKCVIKGCGNISMFKQSHQFPSMPDRCQLWLQAIGPHLDDDLVGLPMDKFKRRIVCVDHFEPSCISPQSPRFLKRTAVPSIFPEDGVPVPPHIPTVPRVPLRSAVAPPRTIVLPKAKPEDREKMFLINKSASPLTAQPAGLTLLIKPLQNNGPPTHEQLERRLLDAAQESTETELPMLYVSSQYGRRGPTKPALKITKVYPNRKTQKPEEPAPEVKIVEPLLAEREGFPAEYLDEWEEQRLEVESVQAPDSEESLPGQEQPEQLLTGAEFVTEEIHNGIQVMAVEESEDWCEVEAAENNNVGGARIAAHAPVSPSPIYVPPAPPLADSSPFVPQFVPYLLLGGGAASVAAFRAIRAHEPTAKILVVTNEYAYPYRRTLLSKSAFWRRTELADIDQFSYAKPNGERCSLLHESESYYTAPEDLWSEGGVAVARGYTVRRVDAERRAVIVSAAGRPDHTVLYGKCLIATGALPRRLPVLANSSAEVRERCVTLRSAWDARELWRRLGAARGALVVGGGYLGCEVAGALADRARSTGAGTLVTHIFREAGVMWHALPDYLARWSARQLAGQGVQVWANTEILNAYMKDDRVTLELSNAQILEVDLVVVCVGSEPCTDFAAASGLEVHRQLGGLVVNADYCVHEDLYAAGDVACYYAARRGRTRGEHAAHARASGRLCGLLMCGAPQPRRPLTEIRGRIGRVRYEAIGIVDSNLEMTGAFSNVIQMEGSDKNYDQGVVFYVHEWEVVGVLVWNLRGRMRIARQVLTDEQMRTGEISDLADLFISSDSSLARLEEEVHAPELSGRDQPEPVQTYLCGECEETRDARRTFSSKGDLSRHISEEHPSTVSCEVCTEKLASKALLREHCLGHAYAGRINAVVDFS